MLAVVNAVFSERAMLTVTVNGAPGATVCMLLVEIGLEKVRRGSLRLGVYDQVFRDFTLALHIILSGLTLSNLKTY